MFIRHVCVEALDAFKSMLSLGAALHPAEVWPFPVRVLRTYPSVLPHAFFHAICPLAMVTDENFILQGMT